MHWPFTDRFASSRCHDARSIRMAFMRDMTSPAAPAPEITYRRARMEDAERTFEIVQEAQGDLDRSMGRELHAALPAARVIRFRHFCVRYDGGRFWVAEAGGRMVAAAYATLRD